MNDLDLMIMGDNPMRRAARAPSLSSHWIARRVAEIGLPGDVIVCDAAHLRLAPPPLSVRDTWLCQRQRLPGAATCPLWALFAWVSYFDPFYVFFRPFSRNVMFWTIPDSMAQSVFDFDAPKIVKLIILNYLMTVSASGSHTGATA